MHVGKAGRRPLRAMSPSTSSASSRRRPPSRTSSTARSRASRDTFPAWRSASCRSGSIPLHSQRRRPLPQDFCLLLGEVDDGGLAAERRGSTINVQVHVVPELLLG